MSEIEVQLLMNQAEALRESSKYSEAIKVYLKAIGEAGEIYKAGKQDDLWIKKVISMAGNGMGICYSKWGFTLEAIDNFIDAEKHAPDEESRRLIRRNLDKLVDKVVDKTYAEGKSPSPGNEIKKCHCDNPDCAKCLAVNCESPICPVHKWEKKMRWRKTRIGPHQG